MWFYASRLGMHGIRVVVKVEAVCASGRWCGRLDAGALGEPNDYSGRQPPDDQILVLTPDHLSR